MNLDDLLQLMDRAAANLAKLDAVWERAQPMLPSGPSRGSSREYEDLRRAWNALLSGLPPIDGWTVDGELPDADETGQAFIDYADIGEPPFALMNQLEEPGTFVREGRCDVGVGLSAWWVSRRSSLRCGPGFSLCSKEAVLVAENEWLAAWEAALAADAGGVPAGKAGGRAVGLMVRLTPGERASWHEAARAAGRGKTAAWVREVVTAHLEGGSSRPAAADAEVARVRAELARIGNNLNQLARQVNAGALGGPPLQYVRVVQELESTSRMLGQIRDALRERS